MNEIEQKKPFLTNEQYQYLVNISGIIILQMLKGRVLNVIESCDMPKKQEIAVKRTVVDLLYRANEDINTTLHEVLEK